MSRKTTDFHAFQGIQIECRNTVRRFDGTITFFSIILPILWLFSSRIMIVKLLLYYAMLEVKPG